MRGTVAALAFETTNTLLITGLGMEQPAVLWTIGLFGKKVLPRLRQALW
jgi:hypothetical protein